MRLYPAIRAQMGDWKYYIVRMKMREIAQEVELAHDFYEDKTLSEAIQRTLGERRVKEEIVGYLARRADRFFSSIVVAAMQGEPAWTPVEIDTQVVPAVFANTKNFRDSFGILSFGDEPKYYALDGQHRVAAIKLLVNRRDIEIPIPSNFDEDLLSVIVVLREEHDVPEGEWLRRYRRLFSSLNRYAKPTDRDTNIIMDEDDLFAILTRRLITDHSFFKAPGREKESFKVETNGKNLKNNATQFTTLQTLYQVNTILMSTRERANRGWFPGGGELDKQIRPDEDYIDEFYNELSDYWDAIISALPDLHERPQNMRQHDQEETTTEPEERVQDHLGFYPIGQEIIAQLVREILDNKFPEGGYTDTKRMIEALDPIGKISWELHDPPWRHLLLVQTRKKGGEKSWKMRSEDRKLATNVAHELLQWMANLVSRTDEEVQELRTRWEDMLYYDSRTEDYEPTSYKEEQHEVDNMWNVVIEMRKRILEDD